MILLEGDFLKIQVGEVSQKRQHSSALHMLRLIIKCIFALKSHECHNRKPSRVTYKWTILFETLTMTPWLYFAEEGSSGLPGQLLKDISMRFMWQKALLKGKSIYPGGAF